MKRAARILLFMWTLVLVQPAFAWFGGKSAYGNCSKQELIKTPCSTAKTVTSACAKKKAIKTDCSGKKDNHRSKSDSNDNCRTEACNPTLGCSSGNFYVHQHAQIAVLPLCVLKQMAVVTDDNRIIKNRSECWHPPES